MMNAQHWLGLDPGHLVTVAGNAPHRLMPAAADAFCAMQQAARADGIDLALASSYRDFARQQLIWNGKFTGQRSVHDDAGQPVDVLMLDAPARLQAILRWSALPGTSRHHWGTDMDVYAPDLLPEGTSLQLEPWEYAATGWFGPLTAWLDSHMQRFGFYRPFATDRGGVACEPWHLSYYPLADQIADELHYSALYACLQAQSELAGRDDVLTELPHLWQRYFQPVRHHG